MKKGLLFLSMALVSFGVVNAQKYTMNKFNESKDLKKAEKLSVVKPSAEKTTVTGDDSYYYWENNSRITSELNTYLGTTGDADGGFDSLMLYTYTVKSKLSGSTPYWVRLFQAVPNASPLTVNGVSFIGNSLKSGGGNITVQLFDSLWASLGSVTMALNNTYGFKTADFSSPITYGGNMYFVFDMPTEADSFKIAQSHSIWNNYDFGLNAGTPDSLFVSALPFPGDAAKVAYSPSYSGAPLGLVAQNFDFFLIPNFTYDVTADFTADPTNLTLCANGTLTLTNEGDVDHIMNPVLNFLEWDNLANGSSNPYTAFDYVNDGNPSFSSLQTDSHVYATANTYTAKGYVMMSDWAGNTVLDSTVFNVTVNTCTSVEENNAAELSVYPNPANNVVNVVNATLGTKVEMMNSLGQVVYSTIANGKLAINTESLTDGVYFLRVNNSVVKVVLSK